MSGMHTRRLVRGAMHEYGWRRMHTRPKDGQRVLVAQEWIDRKYGVTDQFLESAATYLADKDAFDINALDRLVATIPARKLHWWKATWTPDNANVVHLTAANWFRRGPLAA